MFNYGDKFFTYFGTGGGSLLGISIYGDDSKKWWHKAFVTPVWNLGHKIHNAKYWVMYRVVPYHRYNVIYTDLPPAYYDIDTVMLHGMFTLLVRYVDEEHDGVESLERWGKELCYESDGMSAHFSHQQGEKELEAVALYRWWTETRPELVHRRDELTMILYGTRTSSDPKLYDELASLEDIIPNQEQEMLHRLIDIRTGLWT